ncbi:meiosis-specific nuclear structural protein 1-like [Takifugu flavidus]|nr:meiosis-specific nuclear structural protein 1-like [Takifugu flavidus]
MTKKLLATQELQMKRLKTVIDNLLTQLEKVKLENRTLKQAQGRLQQSKITENKFEELKAQYSKDTHVWQEQLRNYRRQLRAAEKTIKDNNLIFLKEQIKVKKHEQTITHMKQLMAKKEMETRDKMLRELDKQKKVAQEAVERAAEVERKADLTNSLHQKLLRAEKNKTAAATEEISLLMEKVKDLNNKLLIEGKAQRNPNTGAHFVMNEITKKIKENNTKEKDSRRETMRRQESERTTQGWSKHMRSVKTYTKASVKTDETRKSSSNHLHAAKTYMKTSEKPDETEAIVLGGSKPVDKADSEPTEKTPDESPPSQKPTKLEESQLNNGEQQEHEEKKEKRRKKQDTKRNSPEVEKPKSLSEDQMLAEMTAISREEQMDQSAATGVSRPKSSSQCSTEGIAVLSLKSWTSQRSLNKEVETEAVKMIESLDDHSFQDKLLGQRQGPAGDTQNLLDDPDDNQQTNGSLKKTGSASVESPPGLMSDFV